MSGPNLLDLLTVEERSALRTIADVKVDSFFSGEPPIRALIAHRLVDVDNGFLRLTPRGQEVVRSMPASPGKRP